MTERHEYALAKILLDNPAQGANILAQVGPSQVEDESVRLILDSAARLLEQKVRLNRNAILSFTDVDPEERESVMEVLPEIEVSGGSIENLQVHVQNILREWSQRQLMLLFNDSVRFLSQSGDVAQTLTNFQERAKSLLSGGTVEDHSIADWVPLHEEYIHNLSGDDETDDLFGLPSLNKIRGRSPGTGELILIVAGPKVGKSSLYNTILYHFYTKKRPIALFSAEMAGRKSYERVLSAVLSAGTGIVSTKTLFAAPDIKKLYDRASQGLKMATNIFVDFKVLSIPEVRKLVYYYYHRHGVRDFLFDRLGLFQEVISDEFAGRRKVTMALRQLANELPEPIRIVLSAETVNQRAKDPSKRPHPSDAFGGTGMQADCTQLYLLYRPSHSDPNTKEFDAGPWKGYAAKVPGTGFHFMEVYVGLNNNGPMHGSALVVLDTEKQLLSDIAETYGEFGQKDPTDEIRRIVAGENSFDPKWLTDIMQPVDGPDEEEEEDIFEKKVNSNGQKKGPLF